MVEEATPSVPQKRERPRDELGRPLPWGAENRLQMEDYDNLPPDEDHRLALDHFNAGRFFPAHEAWESAWRQLRGTDEEQFFHGLAQLGAGYTHYLRGNPHGAHTLMRRALRRIQSYRPRHRGLDLDALSRAVTASADAIEASEKAGQAMPQIAFPRI
jgi:hypothetical protein